MSFFTNSVRKKLFFSITVCALVFLGIFFLLFFFFYDDHLMFQTKQSLITAYHGIDNRYERDAEALNNYLNTLQDTSSIRVTIVENGIVVYEGRPRTEFKTPFGEQFIPRTPYDIAVAFFLEQSELNEQTPLRIFISNEDSADGSGRFVLAGYLDENAYVILNIPLPIIRESQRATGFFIIFAGLAALLVSIILGFFMARHYARPLVEIRNIARKMAHLDFSDRYRGDDTDEIGELGESINSLSAQLEETISCLQEANVWLEAEVAKERRIDRMRKDFIINVSHELKTPLAVISGYAEGLKVNINEKPEDKDFYCSVIMDECERMSKLVGQLLSLSKIEAGNVLPEPELFDMREFTEGVIAKIAILANSKNICLTTELSSCQVRADLDMTEQVLMNLLSNAVHHSPEGGLIIVRGERHTNDKLRVYVYNRGELIPDEEQEKIWGSFYKVDKARTRAYGGTGIGLSVVKAVMEAQNNSYGVSNKSDGVEFFFDLDICESEDYEDEKGGSR